MITTLKTPSLLNQFSIIEEYPNHLDLNKRFWRYLFSKEFYFKYINFNDSFILNLLDSIIDKDKQFISYISNYQDINLLKDSHKAFFTLINFYNKTLFNKNGIDLSITRAFILNHFNNSLATNIIHDILESIPYSNSFSIKIYFDNEIHTALIISKFLKEKFNSFIEIDTFSKSDEQVDFSSYSVLESHSFVDRVITYKNQNSSLIVPFKQFSNPFFINSSNSTVIRFFKNACFWNKCSFCTINAKHSLTNASEKINYTIEKHISFLKQNTHFKYIFFSDEAIEHSVLIKFCKRILEEGIHIKMSIRARYKKSYSEDEVKLMAQAGLKFLGIGLESASNRLNLLVNKRDFDLDISEINDSISLFNKYNINLHQYFMIGLPSETKEETDLTLSFIYDNLFNRNYFTFSANVFSLNKGSDIYNNPSNFGIQLLPHDFKSQGVPFKNIGENTYPFLDLQKKSFEIYSYMFFDKSFIHDKFSYGYSFWDFLDRTSLFYHHKLLFDKNPYF